MAAILGLPTSKPGPYDADLVVRAAGAAAITTHAGTWASPDYSSSAIDLGHGATHAALVIRNIAITLAGANDTLAYIAVFGTDSAGTTQAMLACLAVGCKEVTGNTDDTVTGDRAVILPFCTAMGTRFYQKVFVAVVAAGTSISLDFEAHIVPRLKY